MGCNLQKMETYDVGRVVRDNDSGTVTAQLIKPPASCPDGSYNSKKAEVRVSQGMNPQLMFDRQANHAVIVVPNESYVTVLNPGHGFGFYLALVVIIGAGLTGILYLLKRRELEPAQPEKPNDPYIVPPVYSPRPYNGSRPVPRTQPPQPISTPPAAPTVVVQSNNDGLLTGMMIGSMMSDRRDREVIIERDREVYHDQVVEQPVQSASNDDDSYSSDSSSSDSYSSDSSSDDSYSSDSGSDSYSSDSSDSDS
jgi:hypothetical protein